jgi:glutamate dehydrogenase
MEKHRLRREIIATVLSNKIVDVGGAIFLDRVREIGVVDTGSIAKGFAAARAIFNLDEAIASVQKLDLKVPAALQSELLIEINKLLQRQCFWLGRRLSQGDPAGPMTVQDLIAIYGAGVKELAALEFEFVSVARRHAMDARVASLKSAGTPTALAKTVVSLDALACATDIIDIAVVRAMPLEGVARLYHGLGAMIGLDDVRQAAMSTRSSDHWDHVATRRLVEEFMTGQSVLTHSLCEFASKQSFSKQSFSTQSSAARDGKWSKAILENWSALNAIDIERMSQAIKELQSSPGGWTFAKLAIASGQVQQLAKSARCAV